MRKVKIIIKGTPKRKGSRMYKSFPKGVVFTIEIEFKTKFTVERVREEINAALPEMRENNPGMKISIDKSSKY